MLNELIVKTPDELSSLTENQLDSYVNDCSIKILEKIEASDEKIKNAQAKANDASQMKTGIFGKTAKKTSAVADGLVITNEAVAEMNDLLQEIIQFVCLTLRFAQKMHESIEYMIEDGFTGRDGQFHTLTEDSKKIARRVLDESSRYAKSQIENEIKNREQDCKIESILEKINTKEKIDEEQAQRLNDLHKLLYDKNTIDQNQEKAIQDNSKAIKLLFEYMNQKNEIDRAQQDDIDNIKRSKNYKNILAFIFSIIALSISIISLFLKII